MYPDWVCGAGWAVLAVLAGPATAVITSQGSNTANTSQGEAMCLEFSVICYFYTWKSSWVLLAAV